MKCPHCGSAIRQVKAGLNRSRTQRYLCRICNRIYTPKRKKKNYSDLAHLAAAIMYHSGYTYADIAKVFSVSTESARLWVEKYRGGLVMTINFEEWVLDIPSFTHLGDRIDSD